MNSLSQFIKEHKNCRYYFKTIGGESFLIAPRGELVTIFNKYGRILKPIDFLEYLQRFEKELDGSALELKKRIEKQIVIEGV